MLTPLALRPLDRAGRWPTDVAIWRLDIASAPQPLDALPAWLDEAELQRAARYRQPADQARFISTRCALRGVLGEVTGLHPAALRFDSGPFGKPFLAGFPDLSFNVSHAGMHGLIAISARRHVGVDIERLDPAFDWRQIADMVCSAQEQRAIHAAPPSDEQRLFLRCWTAKEAILKALGTGIGAGMTSVTVDPLATGEGRAAVPGAEAIRFHWLTELDGYMGCVAFGDAP